MKSFKRIRTNHTGVSFPESEIENISRCFEEQFQQLYPVSMENKVFQTYGQIFPDELLLIVSLVDEKSTNSPISFFLSKSITSEDIDDSQGAKKALETMVDLVGIFFDEVLSTNGWNNYSLAWVEESYKDLTYYAKSTRENIELTLQANLLLGEDFDEDSDLNTDHLDKSKFH